MTDTWTWATVTQATPLRIKVDGDTTALNATTDDLVGSLAVDDRVRVHLHSDGIIVTGIQGGVVGTPGATAATPNTLALRDGDGRLKAADGVADDDVATVGQLGQWTTYTPAVADLTLGNGTITGKYSVTNGTATVVIKIFIGSTTTMGTAFISMPVTPDMEVKCSCMFLDSGSNYYEGFARTSGANISVWALANSSHARQAITATFPFTWASSDVIYVSATFLVA